VTDFKPSYSDDGMVTTNEYQPEFHQEKAPRERGQVVHTCLPTSRRRKHTSAYET
jgi:hypothetical protein